MVDATVQAGADAVGFVFYAPSVRAVNVSLAQSLCERLPPFVTPVGLFVNAAPADIESALRAIAVRPETRLVDCAAQFPLAQALLLDAPVEGYGGGGKVFDWSLLAPSAPCQIVLSGGLNAANVADGMRTVRPWAVDVSSGVESSRGVKDPGLIHAFCAAVRAADAA
jgi:phosphoribosylanthranilate isomerase